LLEEFGLFLGEAGFNPNSEIEKRSLCGKGYGHRD
jgi:hypothetical protein